MEKGEDVIRIKADEVGTLSIKSGAAVAMYLGERPVYTFMMIGRWSYAFLRYIRKRVEQFSHHVSARILCFESHEYILDLAPGVSHLNPRKRKHTDNAEIRRNIGGNLF